MAIEPPAELLGVWDQALANFGEKAVAYVLDAALGERPAVEDDRRWEVIRTLAIPIDDGNLAPERRVSLRCHFLSRIINGTDQTYLEVCRATVGGRLPLPLGDAIVDAFVRLVFNGLAMELVSGSEWDRFSITASFQDPALCNPAAAAFLQDADLKILFPEANQAPDTRGLVSATSLLMWLPLGGGTTHLGIVIGSFVEQTLARMRFLDALTEENIESFVRESLDQLRKFSRGEEISILFLTGLIGIEVDAPLDRGSWGIRPSSGLAINELPHVGEPGSRSVLWTRTPHRLLSAARADVSEDQINAMFNELNERATNFQAELRRRTMSLQFGLLAWAVESGHESPINVLTTSSWSLIPLSQTQSPFPLSQDGHAHSTHLDAEDLNIVADIIEEIGEVTPRLDVALSRMIRVASERRDPVDALIDAVVAWENMVGSKAETTFKVCAAMAWLLEPDEEEKRFALFSKAKKIYALRSDLVHGSVDADPNLAPKYGQEALAISVRAFRRIHADSTLKELRSSSRSERLLMRSGA